MKTAKDIYTITIKQIVRFQEKMHFEKIQINQVQNVRLLVQLSNTVYQISAM